MIYIFVSILRIRKLAAYFLSLDPKTVAAWIKKSRYEQRKSCKKTSILDPYKLDIRREFEISQHSAQSIFISLKNQGFTGGYTIVKNYIAILKRNLNTSGELNCSKDLLPLAWMLKLLQGKIDAISLVNEHAVNISLEDAETLITKIREGNLRERNRAIIVISKLKGIHNSVVSNFLMLNIRTVKGVIQKYASLGISKLFIIREGTIRKHEQNKYKDALFSILHAPPSDYDINRTSWTMEDLHRIMKNQGLSINKGSIRKIIKAAGFRFRKAIKVLTSTDPEYREKLIAITKILSNLTERECFFQLMSMDHLQLR